MPWIEIICSVVALIIGFILGRVLPNGRQPSHVDDTSNEQPLQQLKRDLHIQLANADTLMEQSQALQQQLRDQLTTLHQLANNNGEQDQGPSAPKDYASTRHGLINATDSHQAK